jgi:2-oxoisovalerate dehydrogenase E1 component beta subunit
VIDTTIAEAAIVGAGIGLAISGWRPIIELQFAEFISCAYDQPVTEALTPDGSSRRWSRRFRR